VRIASFFGLKIDGSLSGTITKEPGENDQKPIPGPEIKPHLAVDLKFLKPQNSESTLANPSIFIYLLISLEYCIFSIWRKEWTCKKSLPRLFLPKFYPG